MHAKKMKLPRSKWHKSYICRPSNISKDQILDPPKALKQNAQRKKKCFLWKRLDAGVHFVDSNFIDTMMLPVNDIVCFTGDFTDFIFVGLLLLLDITTSCM